MNRKSVLQVADATLWDYGKLQGGDSGVKQTIRLMSEYARKDAQSESVQNILNNTYHTLARCGVCEFNTDRARIKRVFDWVIQNVRYKPDGFHEYVRSPRHIIEKDRAGDCDDFATLFGSLMIAVGVPVWVKCIAWREENLPATPFTHVYNLVYIKDEDIVIPVDCVMHKYGYGNEKKPTLREAVYII